MSKVSTTFGGKRLGLGVAVFCLWASVGATRADQMLWYNGDFDGNSALYNADASSSMLPNSVGYVYDNFIVPAGQTWTIDTVYSNNMMNTMDVTSAGWQILSGVSPGDGGTMIAGGTDAPATQSQIGGVLPGDYQKYSVSVSNLSVSLGPGTYYLAVTPVETGGGYSYIMTTSGADAVGMPPGNDGNSYVAGSFYSGPGQGGYDFEPASDYVISPYTGNADFSMGVSGIVMTSIPEPSSLVMGAIGTLTMLGCASRRRRLQA